MRYQKLSSFSTMSFLGSLEIISRTDPFQRVAIALESVEGFSLSLRWLERITAHVVCTERTGVGGRLTSGTSSVFKQEGKTERVSRIKRPKNRRFLGSVKG